MIDTFSFTVTFLLISRRRYSGGVRGVNCRFTFAGASLSRVGWWGDALELQADNPTSS